MPTGGVGSHFVALLGADHKAAGRRALTMAIVALLLALPAFFLMGPWQGVLAHFLGVLAGLLAGNLWTRRRVARYEASLKGTWKSWMRWSVASESVPETYRRVTGRSMRNLPYWMAAGLTVLWAVEVGLLLFAFQDTDATWVALPFIALNGLIPGILVAHYLHLRRWLHDFSDSVSDMVQTGEIGVWGVL